MPKKHPFHIQIALSLVFAQSVGKLQRLREQGVKFPPEAEEVLDHVEREYERYQKEGEYVSH